MQHPSNAPIAIAIAPTGALYHLSVRWYLSPAFVWAFFFLFYFFANGGISLLVSWQLSNMADEAPIGKFHSFLLFHKLNSSAHCGGIVFFPDALISG